MTPKATLGLCAVYSHFQANDSYKKCIHNSSLPRYYVTKPLAIFQRVVKSQNMYKYHLEVAKVDTFSLRNVCG